jgi:cytochrome c-type biogenesis protein CcmH
MRQWVLLCFLCLGLSGAFAADEPLQFEDPSKQDRYQHLLEELRCLVCQNQTLADSHADLAQDLRKQVYKMVDEGQDSLAIIEFLVARYGDFVLYRPPVKPTTVLLWFGPFVLLAVALFSVFRFVRNRKTAAVVIDAAERDRLARLLQEKTGTAEDRL